MATSRLYDGKILSLRLDKVLLDNGVETTRAVVEHNGAAAIVPITDDGKVILVRQYRYAVERDLLEVPAGTIGRGETPEECAARELEEETGYTSGGMKKITEFFSAPGYSTEKIHVFLARRLTRSKMHTDEDEQIRVETMPMAEALAKVRSGEISDGKSICALYRAAEVL